MNTQNVQKNYDDTFLRALRREAVEYTPMWMMRQAGRYLPEYLAVRKEAGSFMGLATNPAMAAEVTLQPLRRFDLDVAILFSDILTIPDAMGLELSFVAGEGPQFAKPIRTEEDVHALEVPDMEKLEYVFNAVKQIRKEMPTLKRQVPLIGFSGSPWTLACYMVEGGSSSDYFKIKKMLYARPDLMQKILDVNADAVAAYLNAQIRAGAQAVMIFDSWGGVMADGMFQKYSLAATKRVIAQLEREYQGEQIPVIVFTKGGGLWLEDIAGCGADAVGLDWTMSLQKARACVKDTVALQGNLDPAILFSPEEVVRAEARKVIESFGKMEGAGAGHVFNLGHGINQFAPIECVAALVDEVHRYSRQFHVKK